MMTNQIESNHSATAATTVEDQLEPNHPATVEDQLREQLAERPCDRAGWRGLLYPELSYAIVGAVIEVHKHVGPGQLEALYQRALELELRRRAIAFRAQVPIAMTFKGDPIGTYFADVIVDDSVILELKAVDRLAAVHTAQLLSYLNATKLRLGLLINFNVPRAVQGIKRLARGDHRLG
jgi:GxxExxY protein